MKYKEPFLSKLIFTYRETIRKTMLFKKKLGKAWNNKREYLDHFFYKHFHKKVDDTEIFDEQSSSCSRSVLSNNELRVGEDRLAVYTCVFGGYDDVEDPLIRGKYCDYFIISDKIISKNSKWKQIEPKVYPEGFDSWHPAIKNRYYKMHPDELFPDYNYSLYVDGNIRLITDLYPFLVQMKNEKAIMGLFNQPVWDCLYEMTEVLIEIDLVDKEKAICQMDRYTSEEFPKLWGLFECGFILREHHHLKCKEVMNEWWKEYINGEKRDQMSFTYVLWKKGWQFSDVCNFGKNWRKNSRLKEKAHNWPHSKVMQ